MAHPSQSPWVEMMEVPESLALLEAREAQDGGTSRPCISHDNGMMARPSASRLEGREVVAAPAGAGWGDHRWRDLLPVPPFRSHLARVTATAIGCVGLAASLVVLLMSPSGLPSSSTGVTKVVSEVAESRDLHDGGCQDTPGWTNGWSGCAYSADGKDPALCAPTLGGSWPSTAGFTCKYYEKKGLCANGQYKAFAMGPGLNSPEKNCCACRGFRVAAQCNTDTTGTCRWTHYCNGWRGPTNCEHGKCVCKPGYCADSAGTCTRSARAATVRNRIARHSGQRAVVVPQCSTETSESCFMSKCDFWRGATECKAFKCRCQPGYCVDKYGGCFKDMGRIKANVVPVNVVRRQFPGPQVRSAICVSGGGSRSLSAALGAFRALRDLGLISKADAISSVSGGSWASAILTFANMDLNTLLGPASQPSQLSLPALDAKPAPLGAVVLNKANDIAINLKMSGVPFGMLWVATVAKAFLEPFGLNQLNAYMAQSAEAVEKIKAENPQFQDVPFLVPMPGRAKTLIMDSTVEAPDGYKASFDNVVNLQVAPDFTGSPFYPNNAPVNYTSVNLGGAPLTHVLLGGGMISTYAFGGSAPTKRKGQFGGDSVELQAPDRPFSLARAVGMSSAAFGAALTSLPGLSEIMDPQVSMWPVSSDMHPRPQKEMSFLIGDGANLENTGVLAMLQRGATNIVALINSAEYLSDDVDFCTVGASYQPTGEEITTQYANFFGFGAGVTKTEFHMYNQVFPSMEYVPSLCEFQKLKSAGKPLVLRKTLAVQSNTWWGIQGGYDVDIIFSILETSKAFESLLPQDTQQALSSGPIGGLNEFPHFKTIFNNGPDLTAYTARQVNLLAAQVEWAILQNADMFQGVLR